jgi:hypothetical protein
MEQGWPGLAQYIPSTPADWTPLPRTVQDALDQLGSRAGGLGFASFVWRPGGGSALGVYTTWAALVAAFATVDPAALKIVSVDDSVGAAHITTGAWADCDNIQFRSGGRDAGPGAGIATIIVDQGASFSGSVAHLELINVNLTYNGSSGALITTAAGQNFALRVDGAALTGSGLGGSGLIVAGAGAAISATAKTSVFNGQLFGGSATSTFFVQLTNSAIATGVVNMTAGATVIIGADGASADIGIGTQSPAASVQIYDPQPTFVLNPAAAGTQNGNVFTTWAALAARLAELPHQPRTVVIDGSAGPAHMTAGGPYDLDLVTLIGSTGLTFGHFHLIIDDGATFTSSKLTLRGCKVSNGSTTTVWTGATPTNSQDALIVLDDESQLICTGAGLFFSSTGGYTVMVNRESVVGDATQNVFSVPTTKTAFAFAFDGSTINAHSWGGLGTCASSTDASSVIANQADVTTFTSANLDQASQVAYTPTTAGNWNPAPTTVTGALDALAAQNTNQASNNTGTGTGTISVQTGNVTKAKSGKVLVIANAAGTTSAGTTVTLQLVRDAATNIGNPVVETTLSAGDGFHGSICFVDTLPDTAAHTYKVTGTAGAGNITAGGANSFQITAVELG